MTIATALRPPPHCADCGALTRVPYRWRVHYERFIQLCRPCWELRDLKEDQANAITLAQTIVAMWGAFAAAEQEAGQR